MKSVLFSLVILVTIGVIGGCARSGGVPPLTDGKVLSQLDVRIKLASSFKLPPTLSATTYLEVNSSSLPALIEAYRVEIFNLGIPISDVSGQSGWDARFNCTDFTDLFLGFSGAKVMGQLWNSWSAGQKPAIFALWYRPDWDKSEAGHSIVVVLTEKGMIAIDPQLKEPVSLSATERMSVYHLRS